jgi:hypothetical protein
VVLLKSLREQVGELLGPVGKLTLMLVELLTGWVVQLKLVLEPVVAQMLAVRSILQQELVVQLGQVGRLISTQVQAEQLPVRVVRLLSMQVLVRPEMQMAATLIFMVAMLTVLVRVEMQLWMLAVVVPLVRLEMQSLEVVQGVLRLVKEEPQPLQVGRLWREMEE